MLQFVALLLLLLCMVLTQHGVPRACVGVSAFEKARLVCRSIIDVGALRVQNKRYFFFVFLLLVCCSRGCALWLTRGTPPVPPSKLLSRATTTNRGGCCEGARTYSGCSRSKTRVLWRSMAKAWQKAFKIAPTCQSPAIFYCFCADDVGVWCQKNPQNKFTFLCGLIWI